MPDIEFFYFDLGNVICRFDHDRGCRQLAELTGATPDQVHEVVFGTGLDREYETGQINSGTFCDRLCSGLGCSVDQEPLLFAASDIFQLNVPVMPVLAQLRAVGARIGILSNTCEAHWNHVCNEFPFIYKLAEARICSFQSQSMKPDSKIYSDAISAAGVEPERIFFTDDRSENVQGAIDSGMDAVLFESAGQLARDLVARGVQINF